MNNSKKDRLFIFIGSSVLTIGVLCNEWTLTALFNPIDGSIELPKRVVIWIFQSICLLVGILLIKYKSYLKFKSREIIFTAITIIFFFLIMEGGLRGFYFIKNKINPREMNFSEYLGWETTPNVFSKDIYGAYGEIIYSTDKFGFRVFGDTKTKKFKIFVIGDSYTHGHTVSDGNTFYDYLKENNNNIEIFAYGSGGYGSLQEYMILDKYYDMIKPDIILWQFNSNDIINNDYELESTSYLNNNHMTRPYYKNGQIEWLYPKQDDGWIGNLFQSSYLFRILDIRGNIFKGKNSGSIEDDLSENHPLFIRSANITSEIMGLVRKKIGDTQIVAFSSDTAKYLGNTYSNICEKYGIYYINGIPEQVKKAKDSGVRVDAHPDRDDVGHWNNTGHYIVGKIILDYLIRWDLLNNYDN